MPEDFNPIAFEEMYSHKAKFISDHVCGQEFLPDQGHFLNTVADMAEAVGEDHN